MTIDAMTILMLAVQVVGAILFVLGGMRFRRWAVEGRPGIPKYPVHVETVLLWLVYSSVVAGAVVVFKQTMRHL